MIDILGKDPTKIYKAFILHRKEYQNIIEKNNQQLYGNSVTRKKEDNNNYHINTNMDDNKHKQVDKLLF